MGSKKLKYLSFLAAALLLAGLLAYLAWPQPPRPTTPVPQLDTAQTGIDAQLVDPRSGLTALPATVIGRAAQGPQPGSYRHEWPGFYAVARFQGSAITLRFDDPVNRWRVTLDGQSILVARPGIKDLRLAGLSAAPHEIRAEKISETDQPAVFGGFFLDVDGVALAAPEPAAKLIEFIGDSDTVGLADTALRRDCSGEEIFSATDTSLAFGPQVARALGADYRVIARSGIGLLRNYGGAGPGQQMPQIYPLALPHQPTEAALPQRPADILVIGLGSNDFGSDFTAGEHWSDKAGLAADFGPALADFATARLGENPGARLVLLAFGEYGPELTQAYQDASDLLAAAGMASETVVLNQPQRNACLWHPSQSDHSAIAEALLKVLKGPD